MTPSNFNWNCTKAELHYKYLAFELVHEKKGLSIFCSLVLGSQKQTWKHSHKM